MIDQKVKVYICSSVGIDYFLFLGKTIENTGFEVELVFLIPEINYRNLAKSSGLKKIWLRLQMYILYPLYLITKTFTCRKKSIFLVTSNTFFAPYLTYLILKYRGIKVIHLLYDLFPDALEIAGAIKTDTFMSKAIGTITRLSQFYCDATVYLGNFLRNHTERRWGKAKLASVIDISTDLSLYCPQFEEKLSDSKLIIHYGGQLGHLHDAISIIESIKFICQSELISIVEFNFYISGSQAKFLENALEGCPVKVISTVSSDQWREDISKFHIGLVSLSPGGASVCLPSKTYGMMAGGLAIIAICPEWSDLAGLVKNLDAGWVINNSIYKNESELNNDEKYLLNLNKKLDDSLIVNQFYGILIEIVKNQNILTQKRHNAYWGVREHYNIDHLSTKWKEILSDMV
jgi:glycosyltransferase involved in cell wall biosynthesis